MSSKSMLVEKFPTNLYFDLTPATGHQHGSLSAGFEIQSCPLSTKVSTVQGTPAAEESNTSQKDEMPLSKLSLMVTACVFILEARTNVVNVTAQIARFICIRLSATFSQQKNQRQRIRSTLSRWLTNSFPPFSTAAFRSELLSCHNAGMFYINR